MRQGTRIDIDSLGKRFGANTVLSHVSLIGEPGEFIAVVGKSGSGKSTLLRIVAGLESPTEGYVQIDGDTLRGLNAQARMMFQEARLLPWKNVLENVALGLPRTERARAERALEQVGLRHRAKDWPAILSGGQKQRVALARAIASEPPLLLLDEPLGALDALTRLEMQSLLERLWQEQRFSALLVTHDAEEAVALADKVIVIEEGQIVQEVHVDLPRPRQRDHRDFLNAKEAVLRRVMGFAPELEHANPTERAVVHA